MTREDWILSTLSEVRRAFDAMFSTAEDLYKRFVPEQQRSRAEQLYRTYVPERARPRGAVRIPDVDVIDLGTEIHLVADMPGVMKDDIDIDLTPNTIVISAEAKVETERERRAYAHRERRRPAYRRRMRLPEPIVPDNAKARFNNGVLEVIMPRKEPVEEATAVKVDVKDVGEKA